MTVSPLPPGAAVPIAKGIRGLEYACPAIVLAVAMVSGAGLPVDMLRDREACIGRHLMADSAYPSPLLMVNGAGAIVLLAIGGLIVRDGHARFPYESTLGPDDGEAAYAQARRER